MERTLSTATLADLPAVPLLDVCRDNDPLVDEVRAAVDRVIRSGQFVLGPDVRLLEEQFAAYTQSGFAVGCSSGSDALLLALMACDVGEGDEVIMPSYTFFATASAAWRLGALPVFVDIDPVSYNIDPAAVEDAITPATKAILPVHLFGQCAEMQPLAEITRNHGLALIEDAAQAIGAELNGRRAGSLADIGCFSFYPTKNLGAMGDGGILTTNDESLADRLQLLRGHGMRPRYYHQQVGINSRLDSIQAAVLNVKLPYLDTWTAARQENARRYDRLFAQCGLEADVSVPIALDGHQHVWNQYIIRVAGGRRDALREHMTQAKVGTEIYYPVPLHLQECFTELGYRDGSLPHTEQAAAETLALPIFPGLTAQEQHAVVSQIAAFYGAALPTLEAADARHPVRRSA
jgi:dTDP-4-amino-4,6-dideoxygalactose transaminase